MRESRTGGAGLGLVAVVVLQVATVSEHLITTTTAASPPPPLREGA